MMKIFNNQWYEDNPNNKFIHPARIMSYDELYNGLMDCVAKGTVNIVTHADDDRVLFNYNQIKIWDEGWDKYSIIARGLILSLNEKRVVATPYPKFFNYGEGGYKIPQDCGFSTYEKVDGCCHEEVVLQTENGKMTIREICEQKYKGKILSFDVYSNKEEYKEIENYFISKSGNKQWYELELENGIKIKLTGNHKVYLPELNCYRRVDELIGNEEFLMKK